MQRGIYKIIQIEKWNVIGVEKELKKNQIVSSQVWWNGIELEWK